MVSNIKVLNLSSNDYANMAHNNANALRSIGVNCKDYVLSPHIFNYKTQSTLASRQDIIKYCNHYDLIQIFHSCPDILNLIMLGNFKGKLIVYHSGTRYRMNPEKSNALFNNIVHRCITDQTEFMELGAKGIEYLAPHTDLKPQPKREGGKLIIGHYPSNAEVKGTKEIREMLEPFKDDFEIRINETILPHEQNLKRIGECHIYIELFKPELNGKPYGCFGVTAFEATALGCVVITNDLHTLVYDSVYGYSDFFRINTPEKFKELMNELKSVDRKDLTNSQSFYNNHSITSTGKRILELIS